MALRFRLARFFLVPVLVVVAVLLGWYGWQELATPDPVGELARLVPGHRALLARTSIAVPHAPFDPGAPLVGPGEREVIYARLLEAKVDGVPGAAAALAAFYVARAEPGDAERALQEAVEPLDRGAVLIALGRSAEALDELARALAGRPHDPAALFDRALALELLSLDGQAGEAWESFLAVEREGRWADEARERLRLLRSARPAPGPSLEARKRDATLALYAPRPENLEGWRPLAEELASLGDRLLLRELDYLDGLDAAGWRRRGEEVRRLGAAREAVFAGQDRTDELEHLSRAEDPLVAVKALHFAAYSAIVRGERHVARDRLARLEAHCREAGCLEELVLARSDLGTLLARSGDYVGARAAFGEASRILPPVFAGRYVELLGKEAAVLLAVIAPAEALELLERGLDQLRGIGLAERLDSLLRGRANALSLLGRLAAAEATYREAIGLALAEGDSYEEVESAWDLSRILEAQGRRAETIALLEETVRHLEGTALEASLAKVEAELALQRLEAGDLAGARVAAEQAVARQRRQGELARAARVPEILARVARRQGEADMALRAATHAVEIVATRAAGVSGSFAKLRVLVEGAPARLLLGLLQAETGAVAEAFETVAGPPPATDPGECRIAFGHVDGTLFTLAYTAEGARFTRREVPEARLLAALRAGDAEVKRVVGSVWEPDRCPSDAERIVVIEAPGTLRLRLASRIRRQRPEVQVAVAFRADRPWPGSFQVRRAMTVFDPTHEVVEARLSLPGAAREAEVIASAFAETLLLSGPAATPSKVREEAPKVDLLHFGVHGVSRTGAGAASFLQLAGRPGRLQVADVVEAELGQRRPVVLLTACATADTVESLEHDGAGLPWAFLEAGASAVIAAEGALDDAVALSFTRALVPALAGGASLPDAFGIGTAAARREHSGGAPGTFVLYF